MLLLHLLQSKAKLRSRLLECIDQNEVQKAENILKNKFDINADILSSYGVPINPLCHAITNGSFEMVQLLLKYGADVCPLLVERKGPLQLAIIQNNVKLFKALIKTDADRRIDFNLLLLFASELGKIDIVCILVKRCSDINFCDVKGETPLFKAVINGYLDCAVILLEHGANCNAKNAMGFTPLQLNNLSTNYNKAEIKELLRRYGAKGSLFESASYDNLLFDRKRSDSKASFNNAKNKFLDLVIGSKEDFETKKNVSEKRRSVQFQDLVKFH